MVKKFTLIILYYGKKVTKKDRPVIYFEIRPISILPQDSLVYVPLFSLRNFSLINAFLICYSLNKIISLVGQYIVSLTQE